MLKALALLVLLATPSLAAVTQPRPETDAKAETRKPIPTCTKVKRAPIILFKVVEGKVVPVAVVMVKTTNC